MTKKKNRRYKKKPRRTRKMRDRHKARLEKEREKADVIIYRDEEEIQEEIHQEMKQKYPLAVRLCVFGSYDDIFTYCIEYSYVKKKFLGMNVYSEGRTIRGGKALSPKEIDEVVHHFRRTVFSEYPDYTLAFFCDVSRKVRKEIKEKVSGLLTPTKTLRDKLVVNGLIVPPKTDAFF